MPMFEAAIPADWPVLIAACALVGLAVGLGVHLFVGNLRERTRRAAADLTDAQRRLRRQSARRRGGRLGLMMSILPGLVPAARVLIPRSVREPLVERYARAGWPGGLDDDEIPAVALLIGLVAAALLCLLILPVFPLATPLGLLAVAAGPGLVSGWLNRRAEARDLAIARTMPFVLDLLVLTMRAGAPFNVAMERVALDYTGHPIGQEFSGVLTDLEMGMTRAESLENLAKRNPIPAIRTFADDLNQAEELGRPVADTLQRLSDRARQNRVQEATETAGKAKVTVLVPGMLVFIATLILLFSPFAVRYFYGGYTGF